MRSAAAVLLLVLCTGTGIAQQHTFRQFSTKDGLAQSQVRSMAQDAQGYLWFGTLGGASRFDGRSFVNYALADGLPDPLVSAMIQVASGDLFIGCGNALIRPTGKELVVEPIPGLAEGVRIMGLASDKQGRVFIGTDGGGVFIRDAGAISTLKGFPTDTAAGVRSLLVLRDGRLLIGLRNGLLIWEDGKCRSVPVGDPEPKAINALAEGKDGSWWVGTVIDGLYRIMPSGEQIEFDEENGLLRNNVRCLLVDDHDRLWVGTKFGLNVLEQGRTRVFTVHQGMPNDNIACAFQDSEGTLWFGTDGAGVLKYAGDRFISYTVKDGLCSDLVMNITADAHGDLWLGTYDNGICRMDGMAMVSTLDGLPNNTVWCGLRDRLGSLWFGTSDGLVKMVNGIVSPLPAAMSLAGQPVLSLNEGPDGRLWCGLREGLAAIAPNGAVETFPAGPSGPGRSVRNMERDRTGDLWLATEQGLVRYDGKAFTRWSKAEGFSDNNVLCLVHDDQGRLWAGTANGLNCLDHGKVSTFRLAPDFGSNYFDLLIADGTGRIWAGTNNGLFVLDPQALLNSGTGIEHITLNEGLRSLEFNLNAAYLDPRGRLLLGSAGGLVYHDLKRYPTPAKVVPPTPRITGVRSFLKRTEWAGQSTGMDADGLPLDLRPTYRRNHITFDYIGICLGEPDHVQYRYRLVGLDQDWLPPTDARFASYSNLTQGEYAFEVMASIRPDIWSDPVSFSFIVPPPFWLRWWFFLCILLVIAGVVFAILRYRSIQRQRHDRTRQLMLRSRMLQLEQQALNANMNRHFVFNALNSIQYHINKQDRATASRYLTSFAKLIRKNLDASENDTTSLAEEFERLELYLVLEHMRFKDKFNYTITVSPDVDMDLARLPAMMLQPYVENSIWHGILPMNGMGKVEINVSALPGDRIEVRIMDDGIGLGPSKDAKAETPVDHISRGIEITKGRADVLRRLELTDIRIQGPEDRMDPVTNLPKGTQVIIELPLTDSWKNRDGGLRSGPGQLTFDRQ